MLRQSRVRIGAVALAAATIAVACKSSDPTLRTCADGRLEVHAATVVDTKTHHSWERDPPKERMDWQHASDHCKSIGMQLPGSLELVEIMQTGPSDDEPLDTCAFPPMWPPPLDADREAPPSFWTATHQAIPLIGESLGQDPNDMVTVHERGRFGHGGREDPYRVRCVHN